MQRYAGEGDSSRASSTHSAAPVPALRSHVSASEENTRLQVRAVPQPQNSLLIITMTTLQNVSNLGNDLVEFIVFNESLCLQLDDRINVILDMRDTAWDMHSHSRDASAFIIPIILLSGSLIVALFGARIFRQAAAFAAAVFAFYAVYGFGRTNGDGIACETLLGVASAVAMIAALAAVCLIKMALFLIGAAATAAVVHLTFSMFPELHYIGDQPTVAEKSLGYWVLMLLAGVGGGLVVRWHTTQVLEVLTACAGGTGVSYALHAMSVAINDGHVVDRRIFFACGAVTALIGILMQRRRRLRRSRENRNANAEISRRSRT